MAQLGFFLLPAAVAAVLIFGLARRVPLFSSFTAGAKGGLRACAAVLPPLVGLVTAVRMLQASGALDLFSTAAAPLAGALGFPVEAAPLALLRPISGSGSTAWLNEIFRQCGPDSFAGRVASVVMGSTETTFYAVAAYYGAVGVKKTGATLPAALAADLSGYVFSVLAVRLQFGA